MVARDGKRTSRRDECKSYKFGMWVRNYLRLCADCDRSGESIARTLNRIIDAHYRPPKPKTGWMQ